MPGKRKRASITVFLSMLLAFVLAAVFSLLEAARVWGLEKKTATDALQTTHSVMAEYSPGLWEDYHLLFLDGSYGTDSFSVSAVEERGCEFSAENLDVYGGTSGTVSGNTWNLYGLEAQEMKLSQYELATDRGGAAFCAEGAKAMEGEMGVQMIRSIYEYLTQSEENSETGMSAVVEETDMEITMPENPLDTVERMKGNGLLSVVLGDRAVSDKEIELDSTLSGRTTEKGNYVKDTWEGDWKSRILFHGYLLKYFSNGAHVQTGKHLDYEVEYMLAGRPSDRENLRSVVNQLILLREVTNLAYLQTDSQKQELALAAATAVASAALSPELIPVIRQGILAAWAWAESVSDVRLLLDGQRVELIKRQDQWHTDLLHLESSVCGRDEAQKQDKGLDYEQYLHLLMWKLKDSVLAYRAMDLIEKNENICMDHQIYAFSGDISYVGKPLFSDFVAIGWGKPGEYSFRRQAEGCYLPE